MNDSLRLPLRADVQQLTADLHTCLNQQWKEHFNTRDYSGSWTAIALRSQSGNAQDIVANVSELPFVNTDLLEQCDYFKSLLDQLQFEKETVRLLRLQPGSLIKEHRDMGLAYRFGCFRIHIPVVTEASVAFIVGGKNIPMKKGECWYADFDLPHSVKNDSDRERIHLVIDGKRNEWTDELFGKAGYDFEEEKKQLQPQYTEKMIDSMIEGLEKINTETSLKMIAELLERKKKLGAEKKKISEADLSKDYIPFKVIIEKNEIRLRWMYTGGKRFTEPFFSESLAACKVFPENRQPVETSVQELLEKAGSLNKIIPSAFIFHVSRCGSTLLTQMLSKSERSIVLSEVPVFDELLRLKSNHPVILDDQLCDRLFKACIELHAQPSDRNETHLFIKCDSWHTFFYEQIRRSYPGVPFILLYRLPAEVLRSQRKITGMHAIPGVIEPSLFGLGQDVILMDKDRYFGKVLQNYFTAYEEILEKDPNAFPLSYHEGPMAMLQLITEISGFALNEKEIREMEERTRFHSKSPRQLFEEPQEQETEPEWLLKATEAFRRLEQKRKRK
jgi:hypothetical protein